MSTNPMRLVAALLVVSVGAALGCQQSSDPSPAAGTEQTTLASMPPPTPAPPEVVEEPSPEPVDPPAEPPAPSPPEPPPAEEVKAATTAMEENASQLGDAIRAMDEIVNAALRLQESLLQIHGPTKEEAPKDEEQGASAPDEKPEPETAEEPPAPDEKEEPASSADAEGEKQEDAEAGEETDEEQGEGEEEGDER